jgi:hypothetical protein
MDGVPRDEERNARERQRLFATLVLMAVASAVIAAALAIASFLIFA